MTRKKIVIIFVAIVMIAVVAVNINIRSKKTMLFWPLSNMEQRYHYLFQDSLVGNLNCNASYSNGKDYFYSYKFDSYRFVVFEFSCDSSFQISTIKVDKAPESFKNTLSSYTENELMEPNTSFIWDAEAIKFGKMCIKVDTSSTIFQSKAFDKYYFIDCLTNGFIFSEACNDKKIIVNYPQILVHSNLLILNKDARVLIVLMSGKSDVMSDKNIFDFVSPRCT